MHHDDGDKHVADNAEGSDAAEEADDQAESAEEFGADGEKREWRRNSHLMREEAHGAAEAVSAEPAQHLLRAVSGKYQAKRQPKNRYGKVVARVDYSVKHGRLAFNCTSVLDGLNQRTRLPDFSKPSLMTSTVSCANDSSETSPRVNQ